VDAAMFEISAEGGVGVLCSCPIVRSAWSDEESAICCEVRSAKENYNDCDQ